MGKRVLLVTSSYTPVMIADMHRVRHLAWELPKLGWDVEILVPNIEFQRPEYIEPASVPLFNPDVLCHEVPPNDLGIFSLLNMRSIGWRALLPMARAGDELLKRRKFDLIYISTANFNLFCLGRWWSRKCGVPYVLDYHDPWVRPNIDYTTTSNKLKRRVSASLSTVMEQYALAGASGIVSVSPIYIEELSSRYGTYKCLQPGRSEVIPFAGSEVDFGSIQNGLRPGEKAEIEIAYTGAGGSIMAKSFSLICAVLATVRKTWPDLFDCLKIRLFGTYAYWKEGDSVPLQEIANRFELNDVVEEIPPRITYLNAIEILARADGLFVLGVDDKGYMPSKLCTYALSGKPILGCFWEGSPPMEFFRQISQSSYLLTFGEGAIEATNSAISAMRDFLVQVRKRETIDRRPLLREYLAPKMAERHKTLFERICSAERSI